ncbi:hypothetical protein NMG60_11024649 [Bertholletia excelsa]
MVNISFFFSRFSVSRMLWISGHALPPPPHPMPHATAQLLLPQHHRRGLQEETGCSAFLKF